MAEADPLDGSLSDHALRVIQSLQTRIRQLKHQLSESQRGEDAARSQLEEYKGRCGALCDKQQRMMRAIARLQREKAEGLRCQQQMLDQLEESSVQLRQAQEQLRKHAGEHVEFVAKEEHDRLQQEFETVVDRLSEAQGQQLKLQQQLMDPRRRGASSRQALSRERKVANTPEREKALASSREPGADGHAVNASRTAPSTPSRDSSGSNHVASAQSTEQPPQAVAGKGRADAAEIRRLSEHKERLEAQLRSVQAKAEEQHGAFEHRLETLRARNRQLEAQARHAKGMTSARIATLEGELRRRSHQIRMLTETLYQSNEVTIRQDHISGTAGHGANCAGTKLVRSASASSTGLGSASTRRSPGRMRYWERAEACEVRGRESPARSPLSQEAVTPPPVTSASPSRAPPPSAARAQRAAHSPEEAELNRGRSPQNEVFLVYEPRGVVNDAGDEFDTVAETPHGAQASMSPNGVEEPWPIYSHPDVSPCRPAKREASHHSESPPSPQQIRIAELRAATERWSEDCGGVLRGRGSDWTVAGPAYGMDVGLSEWADAGPELGSPDVTRETADDLMREDEDDVVEKELGEAVFVACKESNGVATVSYGVFGRRLPVELEASEDQMVPEGESAVPRCAPKAEDALDLAISRNQNLIDEMTRWRQTVLANSGDKSGSATEGRAVWH